MTLLTTGCILGSIGYYAYQRLNHCRFTYAQNHSIKENCELSNRIRFIFESSLKEMGFDDNCNIKLSIINGKSNACAYGNYFSKHRGIIIPIELCKQYQMEDDEIAFILKHEIAHIKKNHLFKIPFYSFIAGSIPLVFSYVYSINRVAAVALSVLSTLVTVLLYTRSSEAEANTVAAEHSTKKQIQSSINLIEKMRNAAKSWRKHYKETKNWRYHLYSESGNKLDDILHPSFTTMQYTFEKILREK